MGVYAPANSEITRKTLRAKIFEIAVRNRQFSSQLLNLAGNESPDDNESARGFSRLANLAVKQGDLRSAEQFILLAIGTGQFDSSIGYAIYSLAEKDRSLADKLIVQFIAEMSRNRLDFSILQSVMQGLDVAVFADGFDPETEWLILLPLK